MLCSEENGVSSKVVQMAGEPIPADHRLDFAAETFHPGMRSLTPSIESLGSRLDAVCTLDRSCDSLSSTLNAICVLDSPAADCERPSPWLRRYSVTVILPVNDTGR